MRGKSEICARVLFLNRVNVVSPLTRANHDSGIGNSTRTIEKYSLDKIQLYLFISCNIHNNY